MSFNLIRTAWAAPPSTAVPANPLAGRIDTLGQALGLVINVIFYAGIGLVLIFLIIGGIRYITSGGDKAGTEAARGMITSAVIGFIIVIGAFAARVILVNILGGTVPTLPVVPTF